MSEAREARQALVVVVPSETLDRLGGAKGLAQAIAQSAGIPAEQIAVMPDRQPLDNTSPVGGWGIFC